MLIHAISSGNTGLADKVLRYGADPNKACNGYGESALNYSIALRRNEITKLLLRWRADPNATNKMGQTPLMKAASYDNPHAVRLLIYYKADPNARSRDGKTALDYARQYENDNVIKLLEKYDDRKKIEGIRSTLIRIRRGSKPKRVVGA